MVNFYDEIEIEDFEYNEDEDVYYYPCPCGDRFRISKEELEDGEEIANCPSCSLIIKVIYNREDFQRRKRLEEKETVLLQSVRKLAFN